jgi:hypothetical protein
MMGTGLLAVLAAGASAQGGDEPSRIASFLHRDPSPRPAGASATGDAKPGGPVSSSLAWRKISAPARTAAKKLAATQDAAVTRCVAIEQNGVVTYEIHASHRLFGPIHKRDDFVLTSVNEPATVAENRRESQTLKSRIERMKTALGPKKDEPVSLNEGQQNANARKPLISRLLERGK